MENVKLLDISGTKKKEYLKAKSDELETNIKIKNIRYLFRGIIDFNQGYQPRTNIAENEKDGLVTDPTVFWLGGGSPSLNISMYMGLLMLGRQKYVQQNQ